MSQELTNPNQSVEITPANDQPTFDLNAMTAAIVDNLPSYFNYNKHK
jgi:hypothetical protein